MPLPAAVARAERRPTIASALDIFCTVVLHPSTEVVVVHEESVQGDHVRRGQSIGQRLHLFRGIGLNVRANSTFCLMRFGACMPTTAAAIVTVGARSRAMLQPHPEQARSYIPIATPKRKTVRRRHQAGVDSALNRPVGPQSMEQPSATTPVAASDRPIPAPHLVYGCHVQHPALRHRKRP